MFEVQVKQVPEVSYVSRSRRVRVCRAGAVHRRHDQGAFGGPRGRGTRVRSDHGEVNEEADGPVEVCVPVAGGDKRCLRPRSRTRSQPEISAEFPEIIGAYDAVAGWAKQRAASSPARRARSTCPIRQRRSRGWRSPGRSAEHARGDILRPMPFYQRLGDVPRKRHIQFRENGTLLTEEVMGLEGFTGNESILYHLQSPCRVKEVGDFEPIEREEWVPDTHAHRMFHTKDVEPGGDEVDGPPRC